MSHIPPADAQLDTLQRGCERVYTEPELKARLDRAHQTGRPMRVKLGMDPTAPDIHLGHTVVLRKMRQFQDYGHKAVLIIGDYTAMIGDPSGRSKTRPVLSAEDVEKNAATYLAQAGKVLDTAPEKFEVRHNSEWLHKLNLGETLKLASKMTVARMLERDTFAKRHKAGVEIYIHEFLYPLMQGQDSVAIRADVELGGTDQTFNNLVGRDLQRDADQPPQIVMIMPILLGLDGHEKMSKSLGNYVGVHDSPSEMFGKIMSIPDALMPNYFELLTDRPHADIRKLTDAALTHPRDAKAMLARTIVAQYHDAAAADAAEAEFTRIHAAGAAGLPDEIPELPLSSLGSRQATYASTAIITGAGFATSNSEARRLIREGGFRVNGEVITDENAQMSLKEGDIIQRGKRKFWRIVNT
jgi:tyrosyl-tRNA synthetase